jgi:PAS domain S-box-containing protein
MAEKVLKAPGIHARAAKANPVEWRSMCTCTGKGKVTEAHRAAAALGASETRLRELNADLEGWVIERTQARGRTWQVSPDLMGALNSKGYFETSNPAWQTVLGWSEEEVAGMSIFEMLHPDDVEPTRQGFELTQRGQPAIRFPNQPAHSRGPRYIIDRGVFSEYE